MASKTLERLQVLITADGSGLASGLDEVANKADKLGKKMRGVGKKLSRNLTAPIAAIGAGSVKAFADFDKAMTQSLSIMGDVSDTMRKDMSNAAKHVARTTTFSATQAAESFYFLASAGLSAEQSIAALPQVAAFAQAGMFDLSTATTLAADAQSALGLKSDDAQENLTNMARVTDVLVEAANSANASVLQFSEALTNKAGAAMRSLGVEVEEGAAVLAVFADQGIKGSEAGTKLESVVRGLTEGVQKNEAAWKAAKIEVFDSEGAFRGFADIIADMETSLAGLSVEQQRAKLAQLGFTSETLAGTLALLGNSDALREFEKRYKDAGGVVQEVADKQLTSFSAQLGLVKDNLVVTGIEIGEVLAPTVAKLGEVVVRVTDFIGELDPTTVRWGVAVAGVTAAIGPLLVVTGQLTIAVGALTGSVVTLGGALGVIAKVVAPVVAAVGLVGGAFVTVKNNLDALHAFWLITWFKIQQVTFDAVDRILGNIEELTSFIPGLGDKVTAARDQFQQWADGALLNTALRVDEIRKKMLGMSEATAATAATVAETTPVLDAQAAAALALEEALDRATAAAGNTGTAMGTMATAVGNAAAFEEVAVLNLDNTIQGLSVAHEDLETVAVGSSKNINIKASSAFQQMADAVSANAGRVLMSVQRVLQKLTGGGGGILGGLVGGALGFLTGGPIGAGLGFVGGLAEGGTLRAGQSAMVGEAGPEFITAGVATTVTPMGDMTMRVDGSSIPPFPRLQTPNEAAVDAWWRQLFSEMVLDGKSRGVL